MKTEKSEFHVCLHQIVDEFGIEVIAEQKAEALMADMMGHRFTMGSVMRSARQCHVTQRLLALMDDDVADRTPQIDNLKLLLQDNFFLRPSVAAYVVDSYCYALGYTDDMAPLDDYNHDEATAAATGELSFETADDGEFCGYKNDESQRSGFGILRSSNGNTYAGEWKHGIKMGFGLGFNQNRERYAGEWSFNRHSGIGVEVQNDGKRYAGMWKNGRRNGTGMIHLPNGNTVCGTFRNDSLTDAHGTMFVQDGSMVVGRMTSDGPDGQCEHYYPDGSHCTETWHHGILQ